MQDFKDISFVGFDDETIAEIKVDCLRFINFKLSEDFNGYLEIDGAIFNNNNIYFISKSKNGLNMQVTPNYRNSICYEYGIHIYKEDDIIKFLPYHNGHGPFLKRK
jgi:hypothetical protein